MKRRWKGIGGALAFGSAFTAALLHSEATARAVREGLTLFTQGVLPSLFPMMFLSQWFVKSGAAAAAGDCLERIAKGLFGLPGACGAVILAGMVGGYPSGAAAAQALVGRGEITREEGERLLDIAFCAGPGFTVIWVGAGLYHDKNIGLLILTVQMISCIIIGTAENLLFPLRRPSASSSGMRPDARTAERNEDAFVGSVKAASGAVLPMGGFVVLFRVMNSLAAAMGVNDCCGQWLLRLGGEAFNVNWLSCLTEVTGGTVDSLKLGLPFTAFVVGFGGLSVHCQNFAQCPDIRPRKARYLLVRLTQGLLCSGLTALALRLPYFSGVTAETSLPLPASDLPSRFSDVSDSFGALLLVMCLMSVLCLPRTRVEKGDSEDESVEILRKKRPTVV